ncbi:MAG: CPXCG motif-containing cysteine-rich protein [Gammaproteobacteria bacterium]
MADQVEMALHCPYCGESISVLIDTSIAEPQCYVEDCEVCCQPMTLACVVDDDGTVRLDARRADD